MILVRKQLYREICLLAAFLMVMVIFVPCTEAAGFPDILDERSSKEGFYSMRDLETEEIIMKTARLIHTDDEYINQDNILYRVERVEGNTAWARNLGKITLSDFNREVFLGNIGNTDTYFLEGQKEQTGETVLGIYHSHGAESYVPSDGSESIPQGGGIIDVGNNFAHALEQKGFKVIHSTETHVPHDAMAYQRSRRTAEELLRSGAAALFDVHRDAVPPEEYIEVVNNEEEVQIQLVVGRQNQNLEANRDFAESLKKITDEEYPNLIKGIFMARGNYNQDMLPMAILLEVGAHENTKEGAENSVALFADAVGAYFGAESAEAREGLGMVALRSILWIILIAAVALGVYMLIGTGSTEELRAKLAHFFKKEFAEFGRKGNREGEGSE
ncbi:MAG: stage II sporulation protein P [Firmicutes bacterium]|jgi:stage II sporulation protein P|nr:stage II sporulation protein P [Bacillota bacterium]